MILYSTPEEQEILSDPLAFSEWDYCFIVAKDKKNHNTWTILKNGGEIKNMMIAQNLKLVYFRDCESEKKWRKIKRN
jgi:hypothetical protein